MMGGKHNKAKKGFMTFFLLFSINICTTLITYKYIFKDKERRYRFHNLQFRYNLKKQLMLLIHHDKTKAS